MAQKEISFKVVDFEGPLDLLLHLIHKNKLNIYDIELFSLVEQYTEYIQDISEYELELASEFVAMASRLVYIKSVMLLPRHEEEKEKLKKELEGELIEYSLCKQMAAELKEIYKIEIYATKPAIEIDQDYTYNILHNKNELIIAYLNVIGKEKIPLKDPESVFEPILKKRIISVNSKIILILKNLYKKRSILMSNLFLKQPLEDNVATFLAVLELIKRGRVIINNENYIMFGADDIGD